MINSLLLFRILAPPTEVWRFVIPFNGPLPDLTVALDNAYYKNETSSIQSLQNTCWTGSLV